MVRRRSALAIRLVAKLTPERRRAIARKAALARWKRGIAGPPIVPSPPAREPVR